MAVDALQAAYNGAGLAAIKVQLPEQELNLGAIRLNVVGSPAVALPAPSSFIHMDVRTAQANAVGSPVIAVPAPGSFKQADVKKDPINTTVKQADVKKDPIDTKVETKNEASKKIFCN